MSQTHDIADLLHRGARAFDEADIDVAADCYTVDAELVSHEGPTAGRAAIHAALTARRGDPATGAQPRHLITNIEIEPQPDGTAGCRSYFALLHIDSQGIAIVAAGAYFDRLVKDDGVWRISRRYVKVDPHPVAE